MDQVETLHGGRPRLHCVRWGPSTAPKRPAHVCCGQMGGWIKMPLVTEVGLGPCDFVLHGDTAHPPPIKGHGPQFSRMSIVSKRLDG